MRLIFASITLFALAACSIQDNRSDYEYPAASDTSGADWPDLAVTSELESAGQSVTDKATENQAEADRLAARAIALRARAARLRQQVGN